MEDDRKFTISFSNTTMKTQAVEDMEIGIEPDIPKETIKNMDNMTTQDVPATSGSCTTIIKDMGNELDIPKETSKNVNNMPTKDVPASSSSSTFSNTNTTITIQPIENMEMGNEPNIPKETNKNTYKDVPASSSSSLNNSNTTIKEQAIENMEIGNELNIQQETDVPTTSSYAFNKNPLDGWTKDEKFYLYLGIKYKGSQSIKEIQEHIPTKTLKEIEAAILHYKERASQNPECTIRKLKLKKVKSKTLIPLANWAKVLTDNLNYNELQNEIASAFRLIADLEDIPPPSWTEQIDFRKVYHQVANAMEGKLLPDTTFIAEVLNSCLLETSLLSKQFINLTTFRNVVSGINFKDKTMTVFPRPTKDFELTIIRHLASRTNYNPLGVPEDCLLPMSNELVQNIHPK